MNKNDVTENITKIGNQVTNTVKDMFVNVRDQYGADNYHKGFSDGRSYQKEIDIQAAVRAFTELKVRDQDIYRLLGEYFHVDSIKEVTEFLKNEKVIRQIQALREYCSAKGMDYQEFFEYAQAHNLEALLASNENLLGITPEKLKIIVDKS